MENDNRVIIAGAGPVGYTAALNLAHYGIPFTLLEAEAMIKDDPRAGTIHPPSLEMFERLEVAVPPRFARRGHRGGSWSESAGLHESSLPAEEPPCPTRDEAEAEFS